MSSMRLSQAELSRSKNMLPTRNDNLFVIIGNARELGKPAGVVTGKTHLTITFALCLHTMRTL